MLTNKEKKVKTSKYLVAYLDFLGGKSLIENDKDHFALNSVKKIYEFVLEKALEIENKNSLRSIRYKIFSDNVIIASKVQLNTSLQIKRTTINFFYLVSLFQMYALNAGYLLRGGITFGDLYIDKNFVWGTSLIRAYEQESKEAKYPRVIIDEIIITEILDLIKISNEKFNPIQVVHDKDKKIFLDYLSIVYDKGMEDFVFNWKDTLIREYKKYQNNTDEESLKIISYITWKIEYFNNFCQNNNLLKYKININGGGDDL